MKELLFDSIESPIGTVLIAVDDDRLCSLDYSGYEPHMVKLLERRYGPVQLTPVADPAGFSQRIYDYFAGDCHAIDNIPVNPGGTPFQQQVWRALRAIPAGTTLTYGDLATQLGKPMAYRAVGAANGANPVAIVIPCHRLIGADASLTGYAQGLERKQWLLEHEGFLKVDINKQSLATTGVSLV